MPPDLNSLPPSPSPSNTPLHTRIATAAAMTDQFRNPSSPSPPAAHTPPHSLAAAAALNAGIQNEESRRRSGSGSIRRDVDRARRRSSIRMNLNLNDPTVPSPGELQMSPSSRTRAPGLPSPHHERAPSLGELHQELEYEQEGQVNRLLNMIRQQQAQIITLQQNQPGPTTSSSAIADDSTPTSERSLSLPQAALFPTSITQAPSNIAQPRSRSPYGALSRHSSVAGQSRTSSHTGSPSLMPMISGSLNESSEWSLGSTPSAMRDESVFYQAETQMLTRENQMLKLRIRELERQLVELNATSPITHSPAIASNLHSSPPVSRQETQSSQQSEALS